MRRAAVLLFIVFSLGVAAPSAHAANRWWDGNISRSYITNCASIIFGNPYIEEGAWNWVGFYSDENDFPDAGQVFYVHTVFAAVGNACSGQRGYPEIALPSGVQLAIGNETPVFCWALDFEHNTAQRETQACPQEGHQASYGGQYAFPALNQPPQYAETWPMPQGKGWELQIPVVSDRALRGTLASPCECLYGFTKVLDGNSSPVLNPNAGLVNDPAPPGGPTGGGTIPGGATKPPVGTPTTPGGTTTTPGGTPTTTGGGPTTPVVVPPPALTSVTAPRSLRVKRLLRAGGFRITVAVGQGGSKVVATLSGALRGRRVTAAKRVVLAKATRTNVAAGSAKLKLKLTRAGRRALRRARRGRVQLKVTVTPPGGAAVTKTSKLSLKR